MQKFSNLGDHVKSWSFLKSIYLQTSASIQPRTGLSKFAKNYKKLEKKVRTNIGEDSRCADAISRLVMTGCKRQQALVIADDAVQRTLRWVGDLRLPAEVAGLSGRFKADTRAKLRALEGRTVEGIGLEKIG